MICFYVHKNVYLKIFCDGSVKIGIFSDDECTNYIGRATSIYEATGLEMKESDVETNVMKKSCVSCGKTVSIILCMRVCSREFFFLIILLLLLPPEQQILCSQPGTS